MRLRKNPCDIREHLYRGDLECVCTRIGWSPYGEGESSRWPPSHAGPSISQTGASTPRVCLWPRGVPAARLFLPKSVQECLTYGLGTTPVRLLQDIPKPRREHSKGTRSIDAVDPTVRPASQTAASHRVFFRGSGPGHGDLFTWTIPPAGFTIDSHDTSLALLRSLECYHLTFITACRVVFV